MKLMLSLLIILFIFISGSSVIAQSLIFSRQDSILVSNGAGELEDPWAGGLNFPQFSEIDLNGDGIKDLFAFDRSGNQIRTFINKGISNTVSYKYARKYINSFPKLHDWALLADYNCDGKEDIFTYSSGGMAVFRNDYTAQNGLKFTLVTDLILSDYGSNNIVNLYLSSASLPAISDIDGDGDLDVLTFDISGSFVEFHQNMSREWYGNCDSLKFLATDRCWGKFAGNFSSNSVKFGISCKGGPPLSFDPNNIHSGSALLAIDMDGDQDKDLLVGDLIAKNILMITNGGDMTNALGVAQDSSFPSTSIPVKINLFPALFFLDVDNDGIKDLLAAPNAGNISENYRGIWFYKNIGTNSVPNFIFQKKGFLQDQMIDVGEGANPAFLDYNKDGLMDLIIGNYGYYTPNGTYKSQLLLLKNTGSSQKPAFKLENIDYSGLSASPNAGQHPFFCDMDADGDEDIICGRADGQIIYYNNIAGPLASPYFILSDLNYKQIDVGDFSVPNLFDLDEDGLNDLIVGEKAGNLNYFKNTGIAGLPDFPKSPTNNNLGKVDIMPQCCGGYSSPVFFKMNGDIKLLCGSERGDIFYYDQIKANLNGAFHLIDSNVQKINEGFISRIALADLNADGILDLAVGNYGGGVAIYFQEAGSDIQEISKNEILFDLFPNPAQSSIDINTQNTSFKKIEIFDMKGNLIYTHFNSVINKHIKISDYQDGLYVCKITDDNQIGIKKFIIQH